jgi:BASS family bile acid:Na+ symporter
MAEELKSIIPLVAQASLMLLIFAIGLQSRWGDLVHAFRRPVLLARSVFAVNVLVPVVAVALCLLFPVDRATAAGLIIMAVSPLAPLVPGKMFKTGADRQFVVGTYVALVLVAVLMVPLTVEVLTLAVDRDVSAPISLIAPFVATSILLPLVLGVLVATSWPRLGERAARYLTLLAYLVLLPIVALVIATSLSKFGTLLGDGTLAIIVLTVSAALAAGHWLGGASQQERMALGQAAATRHPGIAALIIHRHFDNPRVMLAVALFLVVSIIVTGVYQSLLLKRIRPRKDASGVELPAIIGGNPDGAGRPN